MNKLMVNKMKINDSAQFEKCIICQCETNIPIDFPIDSRENYVVGLGQLCDKCSGDMQDSRVVDELMENIDMDALLKRLYKKRGKE